MGISVRGGGAAAMLAVALLTTGCGSDSDGGGGGQARDSENAEKDTGGEGSPEGRQVAPKDLLGGWQTGELGDKDRMVLAFTKPSGATLSGEPASCHGSVSAQADPVTLNMVCVKNKDYEKGTIADYDGKTLTVAWAAGGTDTFTKAKNPADEFEAPDLPDTPDIPDLEG